MSWHKTEYYNMNSKSKLPNWMNSDYYKVNTIQRRLYNTNFIGFSRFIVLRLLR